MRRPTDGWPSNGARLVVVLRAQLDAGHVAEPDDAGRRLAVGGPAGLDHDVAELLRIGEPAQGIDRQLERLAPGGGELADLAGRAHRRSGWRIALATSMAVMFRDASFCGSSQARML